MKFSTVTVADGEEIIFEYPGDVEVWWKNDPRDLWHDSRVANSSKGLPFMPDMKNEWNMLCKVM